VAFFEVIGKTQRQSGASAKSVEDKQENHDSGFSEKGGVGANGRSEAMVMTKASTHARMSSTSKGSSAMVYGIVQYDFNAERPDELEAKAGEAIIVIAQSNPEWFVAKPIGRLGGPGLIPVSFIEVKDMVTGQTVADPQEAVRRAGVPKVEEWKKMAADYKNSSISLGKLESAQQQMTSDMGRMSMGNAATQQSGNGYVSSGTGCYGETILMKNHRASKRINRDLEEVRPSHRPGRRSSKRNNSHVYWHLYLRLCRGIASITICTGT